MTDIDWSNLNFGYTPTDYNVRCYYRNGKWGEIEVTSSEHINLHMAASCLHYGQNGWEGQKAFRCPDGKIRTFRLEENARRLQLTCEAMVMPEIPTELFVEMCLRAIKLNERFVPPYESGAALYLRPIVLGTGAQLGVSPTDEYLFIVFVTPVGPYFKGGFSATNYVITRDFDRAAPMGTGRYKVGGNYGASLRAHVQAAKAGYSSEFYLDPREKKYIEECGAANFIAVRGNTYITPKSDSILASITNKSLQQLAKDMGMEVECRKIPVEELATFDEAGACGTAAVISPIGYIDDPADGKRYTFSADGQPGPVFRKLYTKLRNIQYGIEPDIHNWVTVVE